MDYDTFNGLTGVTLSEAQQTRFTTYVEPVAKAALEGLLGYPLDPNDWSNLYNETGKTQDSCVCPDADADLDPPDAVTGKYRLFHWYTTDRFLPIDPATAVHKVKLVRENITYHTFDADREEIAVRFHNGNPKVAKYLDLGSSMWPCYYREPCWKNHTYLQIAVDATWAYTTVPLELNRVLADIIQDEFDERSDIKSESRGTHSYTKFDKATIQDKYPAISEYAGPNGTAYRRVA